ncbi:hypothetical protein GCM10007854_19300 [Algimonas porphyrae]|uniref:Uncharacterized protein n=1 Tax=Algimonas porphyrae TaxID=1128113 RepID=A0ABQ5V2T2_9PROT|nr:hypothetical protein GCM10007854_19300 [Algimonas porphyrae]
MKDPKDFEFRFGEVFQPIFFWGVGALELSLIIYTLYMEFVTGAGPSLLTTILPLSIIVAIAWAILAVLIALAMMGLKKLKGRTRH